MRGLACPARKRTISVRFPDPTLAAMLRVTKLTDYATVVLTVLAARAGAVLSASELAEQAGLRIAVPSMAVPGGGAGMAAGTAAAGAASDRLEATRPSAFSWAIGMALLLTFATVPPGPVHHGCPDPMGDLPRHPSSP